MNAPWMKFFSLLAGLSFTLLATSARCQSYEFDGQLVYELSGSAPETLPVPGATKVEVLFHLFKPLLAITYVEDAKRTTYLYDGTNKLTAVLYEENGERTAKLDREPEVDFGVLFKVMLQGEPTGFTETGDRRTFQGKVCKEYAVETESDWTKVWMEPNFNPKGRGQVIKEFFDPLHLSSEQNPYPFGFPFSVSSGRAGEEEPLYRVDLVSREIKQFRINPGDYRLLTEQE